MPINYAIAISVTFASLLSIFLSFRYFTHYYNLALTHTLQLEDNQRRDRLGAVFQVGSGVVLVAALGYMMVGSDVGNLVRADPTPTAAAAPTQEQIAPVVTLSATTTLAEQIPTQPATPVPNFAKVGSTGGASVNVRADPGLGATIVAQISDDSRVILLEDSQEVDGLTWQLVVLPDGRRGWIAINFLIPEE